MQFVASVSLHEREHSWRKDMFFALRKVTHRTAALAWQETLKEPPGV